MPSHLESRSWSHPSVLEFAQGDEPVLKLLDRAAQVVLSAMDQGWEGPPFDPAQLADRLGISIAPNAEIADARTTLDSDGKPLIEFNPNRTATRVRFNIAHEIAHTFFPDYGERIRYRDHHRRSDSMDYEWEIETLCNLAAGELLMPQGSLPHIDHKSLTIDRVIELSNKFHVSIEAVLMRVINVVDYPIAIFAASRDNRESEYRIDYSLSPTSSWNPLPRGTGFPEGSTLSRCTAIGYTAKNEEYVNETDGPLWIECVGIAPFPGSSIPRVAGLVKQERPDTLQPMITTIVGNALETATPADVLILHIVNDRTPNWGGGGFAAAVKRRWPEVSKRFRNRVTTDRSVLTLGHVEFDETPTGAYIGHMVAQHGYGPSERPRIRYGALKRCLDAAATFALERELTVQMPQIGVGNAGGRWSVIEELIKESMCRQGVPVIVCRLPEKASSIDASSSTQRQLL